MRARSKWSAAADELIGAGVTRIDRDRVAAVLAELADGTAPSAVARKLRVGYATVARISRGRSLICLTYVSGPRV